MSVKLKIQTFHQYLFFLKSRLYQKPKNRKSKNRITMILLLILRYFSGIQRNYLNSKATRLFAVNRKPEQVALDDSRDVTVVQISIMLFDQFQCFPEAAEVFLERMASCLQVYPQGQEQIRLRISPSANSNSTS